MSQVRSGDIYKGVNLQKGRYEESTGNVIFVYNLERSFISKLIREPAKLASIARKGKLSQGQVIVECREADV